MENTETKIIVEPKQENKDMDVLEKKQPLTPPFAQHNVYNTVTEALSDLQKRGFNYDFNIDSKCYFCDTDKTTVKPEEFEIVEYYRFEEESDPSSNSIVYAIKSEKNGVKGVMVNAYGIYSENTADAILSKLKITGNHIK